MNLTVRTLDETDRPSYEAFLSRPEHFEHGLFYHTWQWGEFMNKTMRGFSRVGVFDDERLVATAQVALRELKFGCYWYVPRGLLIDYTNIELVKAAHLAVAKFFQGNEKAAFMRFDPNLTKDEPAVAALSSIGAKEAGHFVQPQRVWMVEIQPSEEAQYEWLRERGMRKNIPRSVRKGVQEGVTCRASTDPKDFKKFLKLLDQLHQRKGGIGKRADSYYEDQFAALAPDGIEKLFIAEYQGKVLAMNLMAMYNKEIGYLHGASADIERHLSGAHVLHFYTMQYLRENYPEVKNYNFWGVVSDVNRKASNPHNGYSEFKRSFGGTAVEYMNPRDFVYSLPLWALGWLIDKYHRSRVKIW